jgi:hypothetical protein
MLEGLRNGCPRLFQLAGSNSEPLIPICRMTARCWVRIRQIFPEYRNHVSRLLDMAHHLWFPRSAAVAEGPAQGTDGRGPIRRLAALASSLPVQRSFPGFPDFPVQERESRWTTTVVSPHGHATDGGAASYRLSSCRTFLSQHSSDCLVADPECRGQVSEGAVAGFATDSRHLLRRELSLTRGVV